MIERQGYQIELLMHPKTIAHGRIVLVYAFDPSPRQVLEGMNMVALSMAEPPLSRPLEERVLNGDYRKTKVSIIDLPPNSYEHRG